MELLPIGVAAQRLGMATSALRYYDSRGSIPAHTRDRGRRMYGPEQLRRLAFVKIAQTLGIPLDIIATVLSDTEAEWRDAIENQLRHLEDVIEQSRAAHTFLASLQKCPESHPAVHCDVMIGALDHLVSGGQVEDLVEFGQSADRTAATSTGPDMAAGRARRART